MKAAGLSGEMRQRIARRIADAGARARRRVDVAHLTEREFDVLAGAAAGESAEQTAVRLDLGEVTVKECRKRLLHRLQAVTVAHAIALVYRAGRGDEIDARLPARDAPRREGARP